MTPASTKAVISALVGNGFVASIKLIAFLMSGSSAMLSEAIHSFADTGNQFLLLLGLRRSSRARDEDFPYGYGSERFVFGLLSASGIFFIGGGITVYHGIHQLLEPEMPKIGVETYVVLVLSLLIEGAVLAFAARNVFADRGEATILHHLFHRTEPAALAVLLEDSIAVLGVTLAAIGIGLCQLTGNGIWDAIVSIAIGVMLGVVAIILVIENRELLLGKAVPDEVAAKFVDTLLSWPSVRAVHDVKTRQITPETYLLKAEVAFQEKFLADKLDRVLPAEKIEGDRRDLLCELSRTALAAIGSEIDAMEQAVRQAIPQARHIDLEVEHLVRSKPQPPARD